NDERPPAPGAPLAMLKKIRVDQVRLGMHLHALEGAWMNHPFWKTRFVLREAEQLARLQESLVEEVWIDTEKGLDVANDAPPLPRPAPSLSPAPAPVPTAAPAAPAPIPAVPAAGPAAAPPLAPPAARSFEEEMRHAAGVCQRAKAKVVSLF